MTAAQIYYLTAADLRAIAGDVAGGYIVRDPGLLESATARPQATVFGADAYPSLWDKAAALLHSIAKNHPLIDGNKRLAITAGAIFLARNGVDIDGLNDDLAYDLTIAVATGELDEVTDIAEQLRKAIGSSPSG
ncbi:type II toxin-antitoxin system death-on-curing family toxin [Nocardia flavorosea]|uniref:Type II toxin-antitoxin system death-on-curing family toxin n=1 Tax=Nocardia flavorosea TaxID=53429 RepID=A0A846YDR3_9NOCA|nr:type II toxin-antitoxin system death-on-curing family toxin [Nocardia flavorosea]NKY55872.1 type II toxin-antitoxin system death-on-curing family toxin [Nocardia flavorosea]